MLELLKKAITESPAKGFLIDGYPRRVAQAGLFERSVKPAEVVFFFEVPNDVMIERLLGRGQSSGRSDDNEETIKERIRTYEEQSFPLIEHFEKSGQLRR